MIEKGLIQSQCHKFDKFLHFNVLKFFKLTMYSHRIDIVMHGLMHGEGLSLSNSVSLRGLVYKV